MDNKMSQGTPINRLGQDSLNQEDSRLVDSILNDLNGPDQSQGQQGQESWQVRPVHCKWRRS